MSASGISKEDSTLDPRWQQAMDCFDSGDALGAVRLYKSLAADGEGCAFVEVGNIYELGKTSGTPNFEEAATWYRKAVFEIDDPKAHLGLARMYFNGQLQGETAADAFARHATRAAERGEPLAWLMLGLAYEAGLFSILDRHRAKEYYERAAAHGMVLAQRRLAGLAKESGHFITAATRFVEAMWNTLRYAIRNPSDPRLAGLPPEWRKRHKEEPHNRPMQPTAGSGG
jgi:TPR repeat protein